MIKDICNAQQLSCYNALTGNYITNNSCYEKLDEDTCYELFNLCKEFVSKTARGNRRLRISNAWKSQVKPCGILQRLIYNFNRNEIEYIAGQDYAAEMAILRDCFD